MSKTFKLNGKDYIIPELTFDTVCKMEDMGMSITSIQDKPMSFIRTFVGLIIGDKEKAGEEITAHIAAGGSLSDLFEAVNSSFEDSGFFQALTKTEEQKSASKKKTSTPQK